MRYRVDATLPAYDPAVSDDPIDEANVAVGAPTLRKARALAAALVEGGAVCAEIFDTTTAQYIEGYK